MTSEADSAPDIAAVDELRFLAESLRRVDAATAAAHWDDDALALVLVDARAELKSVEGAIADDIAAVAASAPGRERALDYARGVTATRGIDGCAGTGDRECRRRSGPRQGRHRRGRSSSDW
jgi:hypothetical protein